MRLRLPTDLEGGLLLFMIVVAITFIQLYFFKAKAAAARVDYKAVCKQAGGKWTVDNCCALMRFESLPKGIPRCGLKSGRGIPFP